MKILPVLLTILMFLSCSITKKVTDKDMTVNFPESLVGNWQGDLMIRKDGSVLQNVPMSLHISPVGNGDYNWNIRYGGDEGSDLRPYILRCRNAKKGLYEVDELNGIVLPAELHGNRLMSLYSVEENLIQATYTFGKKTIRFEILVSRPTPTGVTGDTTINEEYVPLVNLYPIVLSQEAVLRR